jgi:DNA polymerase-4
MALAGKSRGLDSGGWFDSEIGAEEGPKSISHEHTFNQDTADMAQIEPTLARLCEMVGRRLREHGLRARTVQLKLRYSDFATITRAHSISRSTELDTELLDEIRELFRRNWKAGVAVRLLGVHVSGWDDGEQQLDLMDQGRHEKWKQALAAADRMRDRFGESAVSLAAGLRGNFRERTHENPAGLPGKKK